MGLVEESLEDIRTAGTDVRKKALRVDQNNNLTKEGDVAALEGAVKP